MLRLLTAAAQTKAADDSWYDSVLDWLGRVGEILTALLAAIALLGIAWGLYRKTLGRRRDRYGRLERLGTNGQISFFSSVLDAPPAMRHRHASTVTRFDENGNAIQVPKTWIECVWIDRDFYVHAVADEDETIHAYSVTTRSKRFHPKFRQPGGTWVERGRLKRLLRFPDVKLNPTIKLGKTRFHELGPPEQAASWIGAHNIHYFEAYWGANPGLYQHFVYGLNDAGYGAWDGEMPYDEMNTFAWGFPNGVIDPQLALEEAAIRAGAQEQALEPVEEVEADEEEELEEYVEEEVEADEEVELDEEYVEEPLPAFYDDFRRRARINTYTVIGPELSLDDYPFFTPPPENYPTMFGPSSVRTRTLAGKNAE